MKKHHINVFLAGIGMVLSFQSMCQSLGSSEVLSGLYSISPGGTSATVSESLYIGPGTYDIQGTWEIYSKQVWISPEAIISGSGTIMFYNPTVAGGLGSPTFIDGNNGSVIDVNIQLINDFGMNIVDLPTNSLPPDIQSIWTNTVGNSTLNIGRDLSLEVDGANVRLDESAVGDLSFDSNATISMFRPERMIITNNSIISHVVKQSPAPSFIIPVGIGEGDYTPVLLSGINSYHVSVQDYSASSANENLLNGGPGRTWHIYSDVASTATVVLQHNAGTDLGLFSSTNPNYVTQYSGTSWSTAVEMNSTPGILTTTPFSVPNAYVQQLGGVNIPSLPSNNDSYFTKGNNETALPVKLINFKATMEGSTGILTWSTSAETNSSHFEIERSGDGKDWSEIGRETSRGESTVLRTYNFTDAAPLAGENLYRLKMVDLDNTFAYSRIRSVQFDARATELAVYPNPAREYITIQKPLEVVGYTLTGLRGEKILSERSKLSSKGELPLEGVLPGIYVLRIQRTGGDTETHKIVVSK